MIQTVIIDDEVLARENVIGILNRFFPEIVIVGEANSIKTGTELLFNKDIDLVFLDINLPDGSGFEILEHFQNRQFQVIFLTAYQDFAIEAFRVNAVDYILKPISLFQLKDALDRVKKRESRRKQTEIEAKEKQSIIPNKLAINENGGVRFVEIADILRCKSDDNYTEIYLKNESRIISARTLKEYTEILEPFGFVRVHQSHLISLNQIAQLKKEDGWYAIMKNGDKVSVSRRKKEYLFDELSKVQVESERLNM